MYDQRDRQYNKMMNYTNLLKKFLITKRRKD